MTKMTPKFFLTRTFTVLPYADSYLSVLLPVNAQVHLSRPVSARTAVTAVHL